MANAKDKVKLEVQFEKIEEDKLLTAYKKQFIKSPMVSTLHELMYKLYRSSLIVPMELTSFDLEDLEKFLHGKKGDTITTKHDIRMKPDLFKNGDKLYFAMFTRKKEIPKDYAEHFSFVDVPVLEAIKNVKEMKLEGLVIDPLTTPLTFDEAGMNEIIAIGKQKEQWKEEYKKRKENER